MKKLDWPALCERLGLEEDRRRTRVPEDFMDRVQAGELPKPGQWSPQGPRWFEADVIAWEESR